MAFRELLFPPKISFGAIGGPGFNTDVVTVRSGQEKRNANWVDMRHSWEVSQALKTEDDFKAIRAFFLAMGGMRDGFRFKDWADYRVAITEGVVEGIDSTHFQLQKKYVADAYINGAETTLRNITKFSPFTPGVLKDSGTTLVLASDYTLDINTCIVTTTSPRTASNLTWSGEFDVPVRFGVDELRASIVNRRPDGSLLLAWDSIPIVELRV